MQVLKWVKLCVVVGGSAFLLSCEGALREQVAVPQVSVECSSSKCAAASGAKDLYVYITQSTCAAPFFGDYIVGLGFVSCSVGSCIGQVTQVSQNNDPIGTMTAGAYSVCAVIDLVDQGVPGDPSYNVQGNTKSALDVFIDRDTGSLELTTWQDNN